MRTLSLTRRNPLRESFSASNWPGPAHQNGSILVAGSRPIFDQTRIVEGSSCSPAEFSLLLFSSLAQAIISRIKALLIPRHGVPLAGILVPFSGVLARLGGLRVGLGYRAKLGAWLLAAFLIPVTLRMHNFWAIKVR
jgi:hypothetical protein